MNDDLTQVAFHLRVGPRELERAVGGPWVVASRVPEREMEHPGTLLVGRAGPCVALLIDEVAVLVGRAVGQWSSGASLEWSVTDVIADIAIPSRDAQIDAVDGFLDALSQAVDEALDAALPHLVLCRYCSALVAPERAVDDECCHGCGSRLIEFVY